MAYVVHPEARLNAIVTLCAIAARRCSKVGPMKKKVSPVPWFGGKFSMRKKLLPLFPDHHIYVEVFGGGAGLLFAKEPAPVEVYNDLDSGLVNFFRVLRDKDKCAHLYMKLGQTPYSREEYEHFRHTWRQCDDPVERAYRWFMVARMAFSAKFGNNMSMVVGHSTRGMAASVSRWMHGHAAIADVQDRFMRCQVEQDDFRAIFPRYDTPDTLFYVDPPYVTDTRRGGQYTHELTDDDHRDLVELLLNIEGMALLSGYDHALYKPLSRAGWSKRKFDVYCAAAGKSRATGLQGAGSLKGKQERVEVVWVSPSARKRLSKRPRKKT